MEFLCFDGFDSNLCWLRIYEDNAISSGKLVIEVSYFGWHIHSETHDLCDETKCPVAIGDFLVQHSQVLPGYTPPVSFIEFFFLLQSTLFRLINLKHCGYNDMLIH